MISLSHLLSHFASLHKSSFLSFSVERNMASQTYKNTTEEWFEKLIQCPYDPVHQIREEKFSLHLIKCRKALSNHPTSPYYHKIQEYEICRWNNKHHIHKDSIDKHEKECPNNVNAIKSILLEKAERKGQGEKITNNITPINQFTPIVGKLNL